MRKINFKILQNFQIKPKFKKKKKKEKIYVITTNMIHKKQNSINCTKLIDN